MNVSAVWHKLPKGMRTKSWRISRMTNVRYTDAQQLKALEVFDRTQSATKTARELGYPGRWTLHRWIRERDEPPAAPIRRTTLKRYPLATKRSKRLSFSPPLCLLTPSHLSFR